MDARQPWEISVCGDLTERQADLLERFTDVPRGSKGVVYFDSCGGSVYTGLAIGTLIRLRSLRVTAVCSGRMFVCRIVAVCCVSAATGHSAFHVALSSNAMAVG